MENGSVSVKSKCRIPKWCRSIARIMFISAYVGFGLVLLASAAIALLWTLRTPPSELFTRYVLDPIPASVTKIKYDRDLPVYRYAYTFKFNIDKSDLAQIVNSRPFQRVSNLSYDSQKGLYWEWDSQHSHWLSVYDPRQKRAFWWQRKPRWFTPDRWDEPQAYALVDRGKNWSTQVLLYNAELGQAYFIVHTAEERL
jgi:hypothetical protein